MFPERGLKVKELLKKALRPLDCLIFVAAIFLFYHMDYDHLNSIDIIYMATFAIWFALFLVRTYLLYRKDDRV